MHNRAWYYDNIICTNVHIKYKGGGGVNNLKKYREEKGYTQEMIATQFNMSVRSYQNYEADRREPKIRLANRIAKFLGTTIMAIWPDGNQTI